MLYKLIGKATVAATVLGATSITSIAFGAYCTNELWKDRLERANKDQTVGDFIKAESIDIVFHPTTDE